MLVELDSDQRFLQDTVRDVLAKECPSTLVRGVVEDGVDPAPLWRMLVELGWTELTDPADMVELGIVLEELGRATGPTPFLATMTQFAPLAAGFDNTGVTGAAVLDGVPPLAPATAGCWTARRATSSTVIAPTGWRS